VEKVAQKICATSLILKKLPKANNRLKGAKSPNLVTLQFVQRLPKSTWLDNSSVNGNWLPSDGHV
jgi:hypothetical protein